MRLTLETERLILRPFTADDAEDMYSGWASDPEVTKYLNWNTHGSIEETRAILDLWVKEYEKPERLNFAIELKQGSRLIGGIDVVGYLGGVSGTPVIGYNLARKYWGFGYMTEACRCLVEYLFSKGYKEIRIDAMPENAASIRVIEKCEGEYLKTEEEYLPLKDMTVRVNRYMISNKTYIR